MAREAAAAGVATSCAAGLVPVRSAAQCENSVVEVSRSVVIARPGEDVFAYLADARNDPKWCPKVLSVEQIEGDEPGPGARYRVTHRPIPVRPAREMGHTCLSWTPPNRIQWREDDGTDVLIVIYTLESRRRYSADPAQRCRTGSASPTDARRNRTRHRPPTEDPEAQPGGARARIVVARKTPGRSVTVSPHATTAPRAIRERPVIACLSSLGQS